jgi:hypothetical protein
MGTSALEKKGMSAHADEALCPYFCGLPTVFRGDLQGSRTLFAPVLSAQVTREELRAAWPADTYVDFDTGLNTAVKRVREAIMLPVLSDSAMTSILIS